MKLTSENQVLNITITKSLKNVSCSHEVIHHLISFTHIVQTICDLDRACAEHQYSALSPWWQSIREMLLQCSNVFKSLLAALLCRDLSVLYRQKDVRRKFYPKKVRILMKYYKC